MQYKRQSSPRFFSVLLSMSMLSFPGCAHLGLQGGGGDEHERLWDSAHNSWAMGSFAEADSIFGYLAERHPAKDEGQESWFFRGSIWLDPKNDNWDPKKAEDYLRRYLAQDRTDERGALVASVHRRPEAKTLLGIAEQLNMPSESRIPELRPETRVVVREKTVPRRVVVRARDAEESAAEAASLREQVEAREATIRELREELERIRRTLIGGQ